MGIVLRVVLNGTAVNPFQKYGLTQNPIPQLGMAEYNAGCLRIQKLGGEPIPSTAYIRETLKGFSEEFIELCCKRFIPGERVSFTAVFPA